MAGICFENQEVVHEVLDLSAEEQILAVDQVEDAVVDSVEDAGALLVFDPLIERRLVIYRRDKGSRITIDHGHAVRKKRLPDLIAVREHLHGVLAHVDVRCVRAEADLSAGPERERR